MTISVRPTELADAERIGIVHMQSWLAAYRGMVPDSYLDNLDELERVDHWAAILRGEIRVEGIPEPTNFVAEVDGTVQAFLTIGRFREDKQNPGVGELWCIYAHPDRWGDGLGYALMQTAVDELRQMGCHTAYLWVLEENLASHRFYERQGWTNDGVIQHFTIDDVDVPEVRYSISL